MPKDAWPILESIAISTGSLEYGADSTRITEINFSKRHDDTFVTFEMNSSLIFREREHVGSEMLKQLQGLVEASTTLPAFHGAK
jgi:hypothetical protein